MIGPPVPLYAVTLLCSWIPGLGTAVGFAAALLTKGFTGMVSLLSQLPYASVRVAEPSAIWLMTAPLLLIFLSPRVWLKPLSRCAAILLTVLIAVGGTWLTRPPETAMFSCPSDRPTRRCFLTGTRLSGSTSLRTVPP